MKMNRLRWTGMALASAALLAFTPCLLAADDNTASNGDAARGGLLISAVETTATVQSIDAANRSVVLRRPGGTSVTYKCGPDVRNFDQIKVGDKVTATVAEEVAIVLVKGGLPPVAGAGTVMIRSPKGAKPGGSIVETAGFTAKVKEVDLKDRVVTLELADGSTRKEKVGANIDLENVKPGDDVGVRVSKAIAISVETPGTAAPAPAQ